jgi:hypothetical protein
MMGSAAHAEAAAVKSSTVISLDGRRWLLATDAKNVGREQTWWEGPTAGAKAARVPWIIQDVFPRYHGVAWYWRDFTPPANPHTHGRYLLRFWQVDYLADVWLNGVHVGQHEGAGEPFVLDVTEAVKPQAANRLAVRVLNPTNEPIDGVKLLETAHSAKTEPLGPGLGGNFGGITDLVELLVVPAVRVEDLFVRPDPKTGQIRIQANLRNAEKQTLRGHVVLTVSPAASGETISAIRLHRDLPPGDTLVETELTVEHPRLWELNDPYLYRVTAWASVDVGTSFDERSARCGFRDFRLQDGYFRLNGKRLFLKSSHTGCDTPVGLGGVAPDPDMLRKDLLNCKVMGLNMIRLFCGMAPRYQIDLCDEIGLLAYQENYASWRMEPSPKLAERFNRSTLAMVKRDRNHPSVVMWGILNETPKGPVSAQGAATLPLVRALDDTRVVMLNSGGWDGSGETIANPGVTEWQTTLSDQHPYQPLPHNAAVIRTLRTLNGGQKPVWLSEYGIGSALDLTRLARHYEQWEKTSGEDAAIYRGFLDRFMADWQRWNLGDTFANPEDYFRQCLAWMAPLRLLGTNAIRANPHVIGHSVTGTQDQGQTGEGLTATLFRELKPGVVDAMFDAFAPLRWCLFVEPTQVYRGRTARVEAVLANEDALAAGDYPARFQVVGPGNVSLCDRTLTVHVPDPHGKPEPPFALPVFAEDVAMNGPPGKYRFLATFQKGAAAAGGNVEFYVADPAEMPPVRTEVVLWGDDPDLGKWLTANGIKSRAFVAGTPSSREVILVGKRAAAGGAEAFCELARHIAGGSHAVFLVADVFKKDDQHRTYWLPLVNKGNQGGQSNFNWLYHKDDWAKNHPIFEGLPTGCILDHAFYREVISSEVWSGQDVPAEVVAGSINTSCGYGSGLLVAVYKLGAGRFTLNTLRVRENLSNDPVAERLLRNMLRHAAGDVGLPPAALPADFQRQLKAMGYASPSTAQ